MLGNRGLTAIGASALNRAYGQPSFAHAQVSGLGLRLWRGLSSLPQCGHPRAVRVVQWASGYLVLCCTPRRHGVVPAPTAGRCGLAS